MSTVDPFEGEWTFPFAKLPASGRSWKWAGRRLGAPRPAKKPTRAHAGCDIFKSYGTAVLAIGDGTVKRYYQFTGPPVSKSGLVTYAVEVEHLGYIVRYGEILKGSLTVGVGKTIKQGQKLAEVGWVGDPQMLHFEMYYGTAEGGLTDHKNRGESANYLYAPKRNYERRNDLLDPEPYLDRMADRSGL